MQIHRVLVCFVLLNCRGESSAAPANTSARVNETPAAADFDATQKPHSWQQESLLLMSEHKCAEARRALTRVREEDRTAEFFELSAWSNMWCAEDRDVPAALASVDSGIRKFPESALLWATKGAVYETTGDISQAVHFYNRSIQVAERSKSSHDRDLASGLKARIEKLKTPATN